jgi:predicted nucleic acid-binding Zn ribbon protein
VTDPAARAVADLRPPRHCYKCGREIGPDESICEVCNRAGMATPSASQYHGTMVVAIIGGVVGLAIWGSLAMRGVGPYQASVQAVAPDAPDGAVVTLRIRNEGTSRGFAKCRLQALDASGRVLRSRSVIAGPLEGGAAGTFSERIPGLPELPASVTVGCS